MKAARSVIESSLVQGFGRAMETAPWVTCRQVGCWLGLVFFHGFHRRRAIATANVRLAFPELNETQARQIARRSAQNFGMSFCELLHMRTASATEIRDYCEWEGFEYGVEAMAQGRGAVAALAHFGAWEVMGARVAQEYPLTVIVRLTSNKALRAHILKVRDAIGIEMLLKDESARTSLKVLRSQGVVAIFPDQHAGDEGALMPMFGHPTRFITSPARLALAAKAPIVPTYGVRRTPWIARGGVTIKTYPGLSLHQRKDLSREEAVMEGTRFILHHTEDIVRQHPDQWLWMHRRWRPEDQKDGAVPEVVAE